MKNGFRCTFRPLPVALSPPRARREKRASSGNARDERPESCTLERYVIPYTGSRRILRRRVLAPARAHLVVQARARARGNRHYTPCSTTHAQLVRMHTPLCSPTLNRSFATTCPLELVWRAPQSSLLTRTSGTHNHNTKPPRHQDHECDAPNQPSCTERSREATPLTSVSLFLMCEHRVRSAYRIVERTLCGDLPSQTRVRLPRRHRSSLLATRAHTRHAPAACPWIEDALQKAATCCVGVGPGQFSPASILAGDSVAPLPPPMRRPRRPPPPPQPC